MNFIVAIVDDDELCLLMHKWIIETSGFHDSPLVFNSTQKVINFFAGLADKSDAIVLFLDINMPDIDGWHLLKIIEKGSFGKEIYVVIVTSSVDQAEKDKAFSFSKVIGFEEKPFNKCALEIVRKSLPWSGPD